MGFSFNGGLFGRVDIAIRAVLPSDPVPESVLHASSEGRLATAIESRDE